MSRVLWLQPTADQGNGLELIRNSIPAPLSERLEILLQVLDEIVGSLGALRPVMASFYTSLGDEQEARVAVSSFLASQPKSDGDSRDSYAFFSRIDPEQDAICGYWITAIRGWPTREIARGMRLSDEPAGDLLRSCPAENRLTSPGHLDA